MGILSSGYMANSMLAILAAGELFNYDGKQRAKARSNRGEP